MARKLCNICNTRPVDRMAGIPDACVPCYEEGGWENSHQDNAHEEYAQLREQAEKAGAVELRKLAGNRLIEIKNAAKHKSAELREMVIAKIDAERFGCWICHPELNEAQKVSKVRAPSTGEKKSRVGQVINVPLRAPGEAKAAVVVAKIPAGLTPVVTSELGGTVTLVIDAPAFVMTLAWDALGRYDYDRSVANFDGKVRKVRNVAEALRMARGI
jgi:hypothetical protein